MPKRIPSCPNARAAEAAQAAAGSALDLYTLAAEMAECGIPEWRDRALACAKEMRRMEKFCDGTVADAALPLLPPAALLWARGGVPALSVHDGGMA